MVLTDADFVQNNELDDDELDAVAGGKACYRAVGGGTASAKNSTCTCVISGFGLTKGSYIVKNGALSYKSRRLFYCELLCELQIVLLIDTEKCDNKI